MVLIYILKKKLNTNHFLDLKILAMVIDHIGVSKFAMLFTHFEKNIFISRHTLFYIFQNKELYTI